MAGFAQGFDVENEGVKHDSLFWASAYTSKLFAALASEIVMFQASGTRSMTDCGINVKCTRGKRCIL